MVQHILEIISRDEIAMDVTYQEAREYDNLKEGRATKKRRRDGPSSVLFNIILYSSTKF